MTTLEQCTRALLPVVVKHSEHHQSHTHCRSGLFGWQVSTQRDTGLTEFKKKTFLIHFVNPWPRSAWTLSTTTEHQSKSPSFFCARTYIHSHIRSYFGRSFNSEMQMNATRMELEPAWSSFLLFLLEPNNPESHPLPFLSSAFSFFFLKAAASCMVKCKIHSRMLI